MQASPTQTRTIAADAPPIIEIEDLVARYDDRVILNGITMQVRRGERLLICGGSGCGKTTLLRHMIGLQQPASGRIVIDNEEITGSDPEAMQRLQRKIGMSFQSGALFGSLTLGENVALPLEEYTTLPPSMIDLLVRLKLSMVSLGGFEDFMISELSGGMKKRAALARSMALDPKILFFDEPSAGLDPITSAELDQLIVQINESLGTTIVVVSHELASIFAIADRIIMLDGVTKKVIADGTPDELRDRHPDPTVHAFFNRLPRPPEPERKENGH